MILSLPACRNSPDKNPTDAPDLSQIRIGMRSTDVLNLIGFPDEKIDLGNVYDQYSNQTHTEEWYYGSNQLIVIVNDTVNSIDPDVKKTNNRIQYIIDSARAAGDTAPMIQTQQ
jgi:hypothetical protein